MIPEIEGLIENLKELMQDVIDNSRGHYKRRVQAMLDQLEKIAQLALELRK